MASQSTIADESDRRFRLLGLASDIDFALHWPLRYEDWTRLTPLKNVYDGQILQCDLKIISVQPPSRGKQTCRVVGADASGVSLGLTFFKVYPSQLAQWQPGKHMRVQGEVKRGVLGLDMLHPHVRLIKGFGAPLEKHLTPVYPSTAGLSQWALLRVLCDELLAQQLGLQRARIRRASRAAPIMGGEKAGLARAFSCLPFQLTRSQQRVLAEITEDLSRAIPMHRLLQGDVGSGKTIIALLAALQAIDDGYQVALLAPTEVLADQHAAKCLPLLEKLGIRTAKLTGGLKESEKRRLRDSIARAELDLVFGTHALLEEKVRFANLGLAIVDEQHRFGVRQRLSLRHKRDDGMEPHLLMMSATPIPRSLAMSYLADLDVSVIDELPPGRSPIRTRLLQASRRMDLMRWVRQEVEASHQVYWVCPLIEESEALDLRHAQESFAQLKDALPGIEVGLVHGRLSSQDKQTVMDAFQAGQVKVLVATTVIEVGVDVPQASLMVIEHAERFGLAQLHQLRGRVGRGRAQSQCVLLYGEALGASAKARLKAIYQHQDGFEIAREDLRIRGPGEFLGLRQSGLSLLRYADLERDGLYLNPLRALASELLERKGCEDPAITALIACWQGGVEDRLKA
ncbi:MAG: ATP-dependent DNA helicase RecG [Betaproteobacteria bacterium]|nr:ATP-dependent DNA helicase RecG [Betaproteobacteria bacterium]